MCGIAGFCGLWDEALLSRMNSALAHRGPDDEGSYFSSLERVGLTHRRLAIVGTDRRGRCPLWNEDRTAALVFNGEIYNFADLKQSLSAHSFFSDMDGEVLLHLYEEQGYDFIQRLNGIFAFVIWDAKKKLLFGARDQFGVKPLYYANRPQGFIFASEIKALLELPPSDLPRELDLEALDYHLRYLWCPAPHTMLKQVKKLEPGQYFVLDKEGLHVKSWWQMPIPFPVDPNLSGFKAQAEFWQTFAASVTRQLMSDVPLGLMLSGGVDSSAIAAAIRHRRPQNELICYTMRWEGKKGRDNFEDDLFYARWVAKHLGCRLREVPADWHIANELDKMVFHLDEPIGDPAGINVKLICEQARRDGIKVLLSGAGGDDLLSGYRRHQALAVAQLLKRVPARMWAVLAGLSSCFPLKNSLIRRIRRILALLSMPVEEQMLCACEWLSKSEARSLLCEDIAQNLNNAEGKDIMEKWLDLSRAESSLLNRQLFLDSKHFLSDQNLTYVDKMSMATGVEVRVPFLDPELVALVLRLPPGLKMQGLRTKAILKESAVPYLPQAVLSRSKAGFGAPIRDWIKGELRERLLDELSPERLKQQGIFNPQRVSNLIEHDYYDRIDGAYAIFELLVLQSWFKQFMPNPHSS